MSNPWLKKNPFMSLWRSGANKVMGSARGQATATATATVKREANKAAAAVSAAAAQQVTEFWANTLTKPPVAARKRRKPR